jgi:hypothetical protein
MPLLLGESSSCQRRLVSLGIHNFQGSKYSWKSSSYAMPLLHDRTPSCRQQPTSPGIPNPFGSALLALCVTLQLYVGPVPLLCYFRRFPGGLFRRDHLTFHSGFHFLWTLHSRLATISSCHTLMV